VIRGIFSVFSLGLDDLALQLARRGYRVDVAPPLLAPLAAAKIRNEYRNDPSIGPLVIIGHSMGGRLCCHIPRAWQRDGIPVRLVVIADANPCTTVPPNVQRCVNMYVTNDWGLFHGQPVAAQSLSTELINLDVSKTAHPPGVARVNHFNIDAHPWIHSMILAEVERACGPWSGDAPGRLCRWNESGDDAL
jgi:hypothetical protein